MKITSIKVDKIPNKCDRCIFCATRRVEDEIGVPYDYCALKPLMVNVKSNFGIRLIPCPLDGKMKEY